MAQPKKTEKATKIKKKMWYSIVAPKVFRNVILGETYITEPKLALNKIIMQNLANLTNDIRRQNINIKFIVDKVEGDKAYTKVIGYSMIPASIRRLTRRGSNKIELSFVCKTSDNQRIRIKPLIFTRSITKSSVTNKLHKVIIESLKRTINKMTFGNLVNDLMNHRLQISMAGSFKKIYPLRKFEIKSMEIEEEKKPVEEKKTGEVKEKVEEKKEIKAEKKEESKVKEKAEKPEETVKEKKEEPKLKEEKKEEPKKEVKEEKPKEEIKEEK